MPIPHVKDAVGVATKYQIAVLGVEVFRILPDGLGTGGYSGYEFDLVEDWGRFVSLNNEAALLYIADHEFGSGYGYILTTTSASEFKALKVTNEQ
jgi:hypothetical protein